MTKTGFEGINIPYQALLVVEASRTAMIAGMMRLLEAPPEAIKDWVIAKATRPERAN